MLVTNIVTVTPIETDTFVWVRKSDPESPGRSLRLGNMLAQDIHSFSHRFVDTKPLNQDLVFFLFFWNILEGVNSKLQLLALNPFLESDGYIEIFVRVKLKAKRNMHCFLTLADPALDEKHPIWDNFSDLIRTIPSGLKFREIPMFHNSNQDEISFVKFDSWALLVTIPSLVARELFTEVSTFSWISSRDLLKSLMYSFNFSSYIGQSHILFALQSNTTERGLNASRPLMILRGAWFVRDGESTWFKTHWITGSRSIHWQNSICHSNKRDLRSLCMSLVSFGHVGARVSFQDNLVIGTKWRVDEPANQTLCDLAGWFPGPILFFRKAFDFDQVQIARLVSWIQGRFLMKSCHDEDHRPFLTFWNHFCLIQGTGFVLPVLEHVKDTS